MSYTEDRYGSAEYGPAQTIKFEDIRIGDKVRQEGVVAGREGDGIQFADLGRWELLDRPKPEFTPGQVWRYDGLPNGYNEGLKPNDLCVITGADRSILRVIKLATFRDPTGFGFSLESCSDDLTYVGEAEISVKR